jgi:hypothetical protein
VGAGGVRAAGGTRWAQEDPDEASCALKGARDLTRRELRAPARAGAAGAMASRGSSTARPSAWPGNEVLIEIARTAPRQRGRARAIKGVPRGSLDNRAAEHPGGGAARPGGARRRAAALSRERALGPRSRLRRARVAPAHGARRGRRSARPRSGVLCSRERMETIARRARRRPPRSWPRRPTLRRWQLEVLGDDMLRALRNGRRHGGVLSSARSGGVDAPAPPAPPADPTDARALPVPRRGERAVGACATMGRAPQLTRRRHMWGGCGSRASPQGAAGSGC